MQGNKKESAVNNASPDRSRSFVLSVTRAFVSCLRYANTPGTPGENEDEVLENENVMICAGCSWRDLQYTGVCTILVVFARLWPPNCIIPFPGIKEIENPLERYTSINHGQRYMVLRRNSSRPNPRSSPSPSPSPSPGQPSWKPGLPSHQHRNLYTFFHLGQLLRSSLSMATSIFTLRSLRPVNRSTSRSLT